MAKTINQLLEGAGLSEDAKSTIQEAWNARLSEAREQITAELREEFAQRYEHDKGLIAESMDKFITESVQKEMQELAEDKAALAEQRVKYRRAIVEHAKTLDAFVTRAVAKEVQELRADRERVVEHLDKLESFIGTQLHEELSEFHADRKALVEQKVRMIRESKQQLAEQKRAFIQKASAQVSKTVNNVINENMRSLKKDITTARENDFGRRIFEAFASEFGVSYMNESREINKINKAMAQLKTQLSEAQKQIADRDEKVKLAESRARVAQDRMTRSQKMAELLKPLGKEKREVMTDLLESVKTDRLDEAFKKYLPSVLNETSTRQHSNRRSLNESVKKSEHTGNRKKATAKVEANDNTESVVELDKIRKLAGL